MKVTAVCPNCKEEIGIDGIKLVIDGSKTDVKSKLKGYIGWGDNNKAPVSIPPPQKDDTKELEQVMDKAINKTLANTPPPPPPTQIVKPKEEPPDINISTSSIDAIGREIVKRMAEFKTKGLCLICNTNQGNKENLICDDCLQHIIDRKSEQEHKKEEKVRTVW